MLHHKFYTLQDFTEIVFHPKIVRVGRWCTVQAKKDNQKKKGLKKGYRLSLLFAHQPSEKVQVHGWKILQNIEVAPSGFNFNFHEKEPEIGMVTYGRPFLGKISRVKWAKLDGNIEET